MKKIIPLVILLATLISCSNNDYELNAFFGVAIGAPTSRLSEIMDAEGFERSGSGYSYNPKKEYFTFLEKEYHKSALSEKIYFEEQGEEVTEMTISFNGHEEFNRISNYLKENLASAPETKIDTLTYTDEILAREVVCETTLSFWIQRIDNGDHTVLCVKKTTNKTEGQEDLTTSLSLVKFRKYYFFY